MKMFVHLTLLLNNLKGTKVLITQQNVYVCLRLSVAVRQEDGGDSQSQTELCPEGTDK